MGKIKDFFTKMALKKQIGHLPQAQQEAITKAVQENPEFFKKISDEIVLHRKLKPLRKRVRGNFLRDYQIFILARDGATIREIFSTEAGRGMDFGHIKKIVSAFYDKLKIPKKDRRPLRTGK